MAPWEEFFLACNFKPDTPQLVIDWLTYLTPPFDDESVTKPSEVPDHHFFDSDSWDWEQIFMDDTYYFPGKSVAHFGKDEFAGRYTLTARAMVRAGDYAVAALLHWIAQYSQTEGFVGYTRCDEIHDVINHIHFYKGEAYYHQIDLGEDPPQVKKIKLTKEKGPYGPELSDI